jgi:hypothetical protein
MFFTRFALLMSSFAVTLFNVSVFGELVVFALFTGAELAERGTEVPGERLRFGCDATHKFPASLLLPKLAASFERFLSLARLAFVRLGFFKISRAFLLIFSTVVPRDVLALLVEVALPRDLLAPTGVAIGTHFPPIGSHFFPVGALPLGLGVLPGVALAFLLAEARLEFILKVILLYVSKKKCPSVRTAKRNVAYL